MGLFESRETRLRNQRTRFEKLVDSDPAIEDLFNDMGLGREEAFAIFQGKRKKLGSGFRVNFNRVAYAPAIVVMGGIGLAVGAIVAAPFSMIITAFSGSALAANLTMTAMAGACGYAAAAKTASLNGSPLLKPRELAKDIQSKFNWTMRPGLLASENLLRFDASMNKQNKEAFEKDAGNKDTVYQPRPLFFKL